MGSDGKPGEDKKGTGSGSETQCGKSDQRCCRPEQAEMTEGHWSALKDPRRNDAANGNGMRGSFDSLRSLRTIIFCGDRAQLPIYISSYPLPLLPFFR